MNVLSKMSPDDKVEIVLNGEKLQVTVGSIVKAYVLLGNSNGGCDDLYFKLGRVYGFSREEDDQLPDMDDIDFYKYRDEVLKVCLSDFYKNESRKNEVTSKIEEKNRELLELKSEYFELTGKEYGN